MQTSIPNYQRPFNAITIVEEDEQIDLVEVLFNEKFATSKANAKQMIKNGEVWILDKSKESDGRIDILESMTKTFDRFQDVEFHDLIFVGAKRETAMCHRIKVFFPLILWQTKQKEKN